MQEIWQESGSNILANLDFEQFVSFLGEIGIIEWREKEQLYKFAEIYVHGFEMKRQGPL